MRKPEVFENPQRRMSALLLMLVAALLMLPALQVKADSDAANTGTDSWTHLQSASLVSLEKGSAFSVTAGGYTRSFLITGENTLQFTGYTGTAAAVIIPDSVYYGGRLFKVTSVAGSALAKDTKVKRVVVGNFVTSIGANAFSGCTSLTEVTIGQSVKKIGKKAFYGDKKLKKITILSRKLKKKKVGSKAFGKIHSKVSVKVPSGLAKSYKKILRAKGIGKKAKIK